MLWSINLFSTIYQVSVFRPSSSLIEPKDCLFHLAFTIPKLWLSFSLPALLIPRLLHFLWYPLLISRARASSFTQLTVKRVFLLSLNFIGFCLPAFTIPKLWLSFSFPAQFILELSYFLRYQLLINQVSAFPQSFGPL